MKELRNDIYETVNVRGNQLIKVKPLLEEGTRRKTKWKNRQNYSNRARSKQNGQYEEEDWDT